MSDSGTDAAPAPGTLTPGADTSETRSYDCPRCGKAVVETLYGPCEACCVQLRATMRGEASDAEVAEYEPKMNVTPNAVALKDD